MRNQNDPQKNFTSVSQSEEYFNLLDRFKHLENYEDLGYSLLSVLKVCRMALLYQIEHAEYKEQHLWDVYNAIGLAQSLVPESEMQFLDLVYKK